MTYTIEKIGQILDGRWLQKTRPEALVEHLTFDTRLISAPAGTLFFALVGERHDGHRYLQQAYDAGIRHFIVSKTPDSPAFPEADILLVADTLTALQTLAARHREQFDMPVIGITGSNGKTIVKEWLYQLLHRKFNIVRSPKSYNSQIGVPLSVWQIRPEHMLGIFEAGISKMAEMERLERIIRPDIGIFTNLGPAHREGFPSDAAKLAEKMRLFDHAKTLVFCAGHEMIARAAQKWARAKPGRRLIGWSYEVQSSKFEVRSSIPRPRDEVRSSAPGATEELHPEASGSNFKLQTPFSDDASIENACHCLAALFALDLDPVRFRNALKRLEPVEMRLELKAGINRCMVINDSYSNDLASLRIALQFARQQAHGGRLTLILSDFLQTGQKKEPFYETVAQTLLTHRVDRLIGIGADMPVINAHLPAGFNADFYPDTNAFLQDFQQQDFHDELVLVKGARAFAFERIARRLEQKAHKTVLEINLSALVHNLNAYRRLLAPGVRMMAMVKASGYGSGSAEVAKLLEFHKVDYLGVAYADEGIELRQAGVRLPILVLNPEPASFDALHRYRLEPEVYSLALLEQLFQFAGKDKELSIHLKLDTGMHRLGFEPKDVPVLTEWLKKHPNIHVKSVFSHLSASDAPGHDAFTHQQATAFTAMYEPIQEALGYRPLRHIANTGGIVRFPQYHFDMVRLGIGLYGIDPGGLQERLQVVNTLKATISQIKELMPGETVGYNRNGPVTRPSRIATISIGYADGLPRLAGNGRYAVLLHRKKAPTIGNVCMDMTMIDVTDIPEAREGDEVIIFGEHLPVQELAACLQTIPYEVFTSVAERVKRVYWQE